MTVGWAETQQSPITWEAFLDIDEDVRRGLEIVDGYVVPREQRGRDHQKVATRMSMALEEAAVAEMRRTGRSECFETSTEVDLLLWEVPPTARKPDAVLHRCLSEFDKIGALAIERCALARGSYTHIGTTHRDMGPVAVDITAPLAASIGWDRLEVAPKV